MVGAKPPRPIATDWEKVPCIPSLNQHQPALGKNQQPAEATESLYFRHISPHIRTYRWGNTKTPLYAESIPASGESRIPINQNRNPGPPINQFNCPTLVIFSLTTWERTYEGDCTGWGDWKAINRYHRNRLGAGALYTFPKSTSTRVGAESDP